MPCSLVGLCHINIYYNCIGVKKRNDVTFLFLLVIIIGLQCIQTIMNIMFIVHILRLPKLSDDTISCTNNLYTPHNSPSSESSTILSSSSDVISTLVRS